MCFSVKLDRREDGDVFIISNVFKKRKLINDSRGCIIIGMI